MGNLDLVSYEVLSHVIVGNTERWITILFYTVINTEKGKLMKTKKLANVVE